MNLIKFQQPTQHVEFLSRYYPSYYSDGDILRMGALQQLVDSEFPPYSLADKILQAEFDGHLQPNKEKISREASFLERKVMIRAIRNYFEMHPDNLAVFIFLGSMKYNNPIDYDDVLSGDIAIIGSDNSFEHNYSEVMSCIAYFQHSDEILTDLEADYFKNESFSRNGMQILSMNFSHFQLKNNGDEFTTS